jgi:hypothetical protein
MLVDSFNDGTESKTGHAYKGIEKEIMKEKYIKIKISRFERKDQMEYYNFLGRDKFDVEGIIIINTKNRFYPVNKIYLKREINEKENNYQFKFQYGGSFDLKHFYEILDPNNNFVGLFLIPLQFDKDIGNIILEVETPKEKKYNKYRGELIFKKDILEREKNIQEVIKENSPRKYCRDGI